MQSNNPIFRKAEGFNGRPAQNAYGNQTYPGNGSSYAGYGQPQQPQGGHPGAYPGSYPGPEQYQPTYPGGPAGVDTGRMTVDTVVQKTAVSLGIVVVVAFATWLLTGDLLTPGGELIQSGYAATALASMVGGIGAFVLSLVNSFKRVISPALVITFAVFEGIFIGAFSKLMVTMSNGDFSIVVGAVLGTFAAVGGTLAAYKYFNIQVSDRMRKFVVAAMFGFVALALLDGVLMLFSSSFGFNGLGPMGLLASVVGLVIAIFMLLLDFDFVERGVAAGLPERESWRAAFGLTVTMVWIYVNLLRILAIINRN